MTSGTIILVALVLIVLSVIPAILIAIALEFLGVIPARYLSRSWGFSSTDVIGLLAVVLVVMQVVGNI